MIVRAGPQKEAAPKRQEAKRQASMVRFYWYGLTVIYVTCCAAGGLLGLAWGVSGSILGLAIGATVAAGAAMMLHGSERLELAFYVVLSLAFIVAAIWLVGSYPGVWS